MASTPFSTDPVSVTLRAAKGTPLTATELDANFTKLSTALAAVATALKAILDGTGQVALPVVEFANFTQTTAPDGHLILTAPSGGSTTSGTTTSGTLTASITGTSASKTTATASPLALNSTENAAHLTVTPSGGTGATTPVWSLTGQPSGANCQFNGGATNPTTASVDPIGMSVAGTYSFQCIVTDSASHTATATYSITHP